MSGGTESRGKLLSCLAAHETIPIMGTSCLFACACCSFFLESFAPALSLVITFLSFRCQPRGLSLMTFYVLVLPCVLVHCPITSLLTSQCVFTFLTCILSKKLFPLLKYKFHEGRYLFCVVCNFQLRSSWAGHKHYMNICEVRNEWWLTVVGIVKPSSYTGGNHLDFSGLQGRKLLNSFPYQFRCLMTPNERIFVRVCTSLYLYFLFP